MVTVKRIVGCIGFRSVAALKLALANMTPEQTERKLVENVLANYKMNAAWGRLKNVEFSGDDFSALNRILDSVGAKLLTASLVIE